MLLLSLSSPKKNNEAVAVRDFRAISLIGGIIKSLLNF